MSDDYGCYAATKPGWPGYVALVSAEPAHAKYAADDLKDWARRGYIIDRVSRHEGAAGLEVFSAEKKRRMSEPAVADLPADGLFA